jgi:hypothetical protein
MGNNASSSCPRTKEQADLQFLAERFPFGDAELAHLYGVYQEILAAQGNSPRTSFGTWHTLASR